MTTKLENDTHIRGPQHYQMSTPHSSDRGRTVTGKDAPQTFTCGAIPKIYGVQIKLIGSSVTHGPSNRGIYSLEPLNMAPFLLVTDPYVLDPATMYHVETAP